MTEADWLAATDPHLMLDFLRDREVSNQKLLRFAVECCRPVQEQFILNESHDAVQLVERFLEGEISAAEYDATRKEFHVVDTETECRIHPPREGICEAFFRGSAWDAARDICFPTAQKFGYRFAGQRYEVRDSGWIRETHKGRLICFAAQAGVFRDIFGNPFRPATVDPSWLTTTVVALATAIYDERAFDRLPILADALEDAGCTNEEILNHCRQPGDHARGCWALDSILGKD